MAHLVLGFPTLADSLRTAELYIQSGIQILELQIPFSHPTADGPVITAACREAVEQQKVSMSDCFAAIGTIRSKYPEQEIFVMSYLNRIFACGVERFAATMNVLKIKHLIVPDLPVDEKGVADKLSQTLQLVPVLAANVSDERLNKLLALHFDFYYLMSDFKITGSAFSLHPRLKEVIRKIKNYQPGHSPGGYTPPRIGIGFGISTPEQARLVCREADIAIIGSALIQAQTAGKLKAFLRDLTAIFAEKEIVPVS